MRLLVLLDVHFVHCVIYIEVSQRMVCGGMMVSHFKLVVDSGVRSFSYKASYRYHI